MRMFEDAVGKVDLFAHPPPNPSDEYRIASVHAGRFQFICVAKRQTERYTRRYVLGNEQH